MKSIQSQEQLTALATSLPGELKVPGVVVGYQQADGPVWLAAAGIADVEAGTEMSVSTPLRIGSISKTFTATAILLLCEQRLLGVDDPVVRHIPELIGILPGEFPVESVTIRHLLTHRAGILSEPPNRIWFEPPFPDIEELLDGLQGVRALVAAPGSEEKYSNLGYALLGEVAARAASTTVEQLIGETLFAPLGLRSTTFEPPAGRAKGYGKPDSGWPPQLEQEFGGERSAGQIWSTAGDLLSWAAAAQGHRPEVMSDWMIDRLLTPVTVQGRDFSAGRSLAWIIERSGTDVAHWHVGGVEGFCSGLAFLADERSAAAVLTNGHPEDVWVATRRLLGLEPLPPAPEIPAEALASPPDSAVGVYRGPLELEAWIVRDGKPGFGFHGPLLATAPTGEIRLVPLEDDRYLVSAGRFVGEELRLSRDDDDRVAGFTLAGFWNPRCGD